MSVPWERGEFEDGTECEEIAARKLGITRARLGELAGQLWGMSIYDERNRRADLMEGGESVSARRGHATRALLNELRKVNT